MKRGQLDKNESYSGVRSGAGTQRSCMLRACRTGRDYCTQLRDIRSVELGGVKQAFFRYNETTQRVTHELEALFCDDVFLDAADDKRHNTVVRERYDFQIDARN